MKIGLTYDLRSEYLKMGYTEEETAEFDRDDTVGAIEKGLEALGYETDRIGNGYELCRRVSAGDRWDLVFNIAEGMHGIGREAQVPAILDLYGIPYTFSDPLVMSLTLHKGMTKRVIRDAGLATPDFAVISEIEDLDGIDFPPPYFVKPVAEGTGKGITPASIVRRVEDLKDVCAGMIAQYRQSALVEAFLAGREFTVGITGTGKNAQVLGTMEVILLANAEAEVYSYTNKEKCEELVEYQLLSGADDPIVKETEALSLAAWRALECRDGGRIDIRCDVSGKPFFLEVNPLAGLHPEHSDLPIICNLKAIPFIKLLERIVDSAMERVQRAEFGKEIRRCA